MLDALFDWNAISARGFDATVYFVMAIAGTALFLIRLALATFGGDADGDFDVDAGGGDSDAGFGFFSVLSVLAFFMGAGWMGLACRFDWALGPLPSSFIAAGFGAVMMLAAAGLSWGTRRLNQEAGYDPETAIGATARVYLTIPKQGQGHGQVEVTISGRRKIMSAVSDEDEIEPFADVVVTSTQDDETLVVKRKYPAPPPEPQT